MTSLTETLLAPATRPQVVEALIAFADTEVAGKKGITGTMMKTAYAGVKKASAGTVTKGVDRGLPTLAQTLDPHWQQFQQSGGGDFGTFLAGRSDQVAAELLAVADSQSHRFEGPLAKAYAGFRGKASEHVVAALPGLGAVVQRFGG